MGVTRALRAAVSGISAFTTLESIVGIVNHTGAGLYQWAATGTAAIYGLSMKRPGAGAAVFFGISSANEIINHGNPTWYTVGAVISAAVYGFFDFTKVIEKTKTITRTKYVPKPADDDKDADKVAPDPYDRPRYGDAAVAVVRYVPPEDFDCESEEQVSAKHKKKKKQLEPELLNN